MRQNWICEKEEDLTSIAKEVLSLTYPSDCILLKGEMGAGKTSFVRALVEILGGGEVEVHSPSFGLLHQYPTQPQILHADLYRLTSLEELNELGLKEMLDGKSILWVEWAEKFPAYWPLESPSLEILKRGNGDRLLKWVRP